MESDNVVPLRALRYYLKFVAAVAFMSILVVFGLSASVAVVQTAPIITGTEGEWIDGAIVTAYTNVTNGSVFKFDRFDRCQDSDPSNDFEDWSIFNESENPVELSNETPRTAKEDDCYLKRNPVSLGFISKDAGDHGEYFSSFYMMLSPEFDICSDPGGTHQFKIVRLSSTNNSINLYPAIGCEDGFHFVTEHTVPQVLRHQLLLEEIPDRPIGWHKMDIYYKKNSSPNANDGHCRIFWDGVLIFDWAAHFEGDPDISGDCDFDDADLADDWSIGNYFSSASPQTFVAFDDVYLSHTLSRFELANHIDYDQATIRELQEPIEWGSDGRVRLRVNKGGLDDGELFLFVTDESGERSSGFRISTSTSHQIYLPVVVR